MKNRGNRRRPVNASNEPQKLGGERKETSDSEYNQTKALIRMNETLTTLARQQQTAHHEARDEQPAKQWRERWGFRGAVIVSVCTIGLFCEGGYQAYLTRRALIAGARAWLYPENFEITILDQQSGISIKGDTKNVGKEPATGVLFSQMQYGFVPITNIDPKTFAIPQTDECFGSGGWLEHSRRIPGGPSIQALIFPDQTLSYERLSIFNGNAAAGFNISAVMNGSMIFYIRDCVSYTTFNENHTTAFCFFLYRRMTDGKLVTYHCPDGNDAN